MYLTCFATSRMHCNPDSKSGNKTEPNFLHCGNGRTLMVTSVTTPRVPEMWNNICNWTALPSEQKYSVIQNDCRGVNNLSYTIHPVLQMQPHVIPFYGVTSRIRFMFLLFPQVSRNWRLLHATVWNELDYCVDVCRITKGAHIEHL